jgi:large subunit ribosomal protein L18
MINRREQRLLRKARIRKKLMVKGGHRPRLSVFRSGKHIYAQIIDDQNHKTLVSASTVSKDLKGKVKKGSNIAAAKEVGNVLAKKAKEMKIQAVSFDRNGYLYHGRVKALADAAREQGLKF